MQRVEPQIIGIVGGSCAGKSWLANALQRQLGAEATRISQDDFYLDHSHLSERERARLNFDHPRAVDWRRLEDAVAAFAAGESTRVPGYDFVAHRRTPHEGTLAPTRILLVEGLWLFRRTALRKLFTLKIYIQGDLELCQQRRVQRDTAERGRTAQQVREQWERHTYPMFLRFVAPQERWADLVLHAPVSECEVLALVGRLKGAAQAGHPMVGI